MLTAVQASSRRATLMAPFEQALRAAKNFVYTIG